MSEDKEYPDRAKPLARIAELERENKKLREQLRMAKAKKCPWEQQAEAYSPASKLISNYRANKRIEKACIATAKDNNK